MPRVLIDAAGRPVIRSGRVAVGVAGEDCCCGDGGACDYGYVTSWCTPHRGANLTAGGSGPARCCVHGAVYVLRQRATLYAIVRQFAPARVGLTSSLYRPAPLSGVLYLEERDIDATWLLRANPAQGPMRPIVESRSVVGGGTVQRWRYSDPGPFPTTGAGEMITTSVGLPVTPRLFGRVDDAWKSMGGNSSNGLSSPADASVYEFYWPTWWQSRDLASPPGQRVNDIANTGFFCGSHEEDVPPLSVYGAMQPDVLGLGDYRHAWSIDDAGCGRATLHYEAAGRIGVWRSGSATPVEAWGTFELRQFFEETIETVVPCTGACPPAPPPPPPPPPAQATGCCLLPDPATRVRSRPASGYTATQCLGARGLWLGPGSECPSGRIDPGPSSGQAQAGGGCVGCGAGDGLSDAETLRRILRGPVR